MQSVHFVARILKFIDGDLNDSGNIMYFVLAFIKKPSSLERLSEHSVVSIVKQPFKFKEAGNKENIYSVR